MDIVKSEQTKFIDFSFVDQTVRVISQDGNPWFVGADVCAVLDIVKPSNAISRLDDDEKGALTMGTLGGPQEMTIINESGLYSMVLTSRKPEAKSFKKWITSEVIPSIRKTGGYNSGPASIDVRDPSNLAAISAQLIEYTKELEQARDNLQHQVDEFKPKVQALDRIATSDGSLCITDAAKALQMRPKELFDYLSQNGWIYRRIGGTSWLGYQEKVATGYLEHKVTTVLRPDGSEKVTEQVRITPKGLAKLSELIENKETHKIGYVKS